MKPLKTLLFVTYGALLSALLGVSFSHCWQLWKVRDIESHFQLENFKSGHLLSLVETPPSLSMEPDISLPGEQQ